MKEKLGIAISDYIRGINERKYFNLYTSSLTWSRDEIVAYQVKKLKELLKYSYNNSLFFRKRIDDSNFNIDKLNYPEQIKNIPPLTRSDLQENLDTIISKEINFKDCSKGSSSGSTGHPVIYYHDKEGISANKASVLFSRFLGGYKPGDKWINIWGNPTAVNVEWKKIGSRLKKYFLNESRFPAYTLNQKKELEKLYITIKATKPKFIYGYTNAIFLFSKYLEENNEKLDFIEGVFTTAENLHNYQREKIQEYVGHVFDHYGCSEINGIAAQTKYDSYYSIIDAHVYCEFGDVVDSTTNTRKIIVTDLHNKVLPFLRYENGDLCVPAESNNSSLKFSKLLSVDGRVSDIISLPGGGSLVVPSFFGSRMLKNIDGIKQYQIQKNNNGLIINLITDSRFNQESEKIIISTLKDYIPPEMNYELVFNKDIIYSRNGKFKLLIDNSTNKPV